MKEFKSDIQNFVYFFFLTCIQSFISKRKYECQKSMIFGISGHKVNYLFWKGKFSDFCQKNTLFTSFTPILPYFKKRTLMPHFFGKRILSCPLQYLQALCIIYSHLGLFFVIENQTCNFCWIFRLYGTYLLHRSSFS